VKDREKEPSKRVRGERKEGNEVDVKDSDPPPQRLYKRKGWKGGGKEGKIDCAEGSIEEGKEKGKEEVEPLFPCNPVEL
jgi:hypothetical protein